LNRSSESGTVFTVKPVKQKHLQSISWSESLVAVRVSTQCSSVKELRRKLWSELPQNSPNTRRRRTSVILGRFFPNGNIEPLPRRVCMAYQDDALLTSVMGPLLLLAESVLGVLFALAMSLMTSGRQFRVSNDSSEHVLRRHDESTQAKSFVSI
jgi:hypothetical protein